MLGFEGVIEHTRDAMWQTDGLVDMLACAASLVGTQSKLGEDLEIWASSEFDYVTLADGFSRASVLMPQKRNPYALSIIRGASGTLVGRLTGFLAVIKSPSARSDNLIYAYGEVPRALDLALRTTRLTDGVVRTLQVNVARMWAALEAGFCQATDLAEYVMLTCGLDYRTAYQVVGVAVRTAHEAGLRGIDIDGEMLDEAAQQYASRSLGLTGTDLSEVLDPRRIVATRTAVGGAAPEVVAAMATSCSAQAGELMGVARGRPSGLCRSRAALLDVRRPHSPGGADSDGAGRGAEPMTRSGPVELPERVGVVNVGLPLFADAVAEQGRTSVQVDWRIPAGGDPVAIAALRRLGGPRTRASGCGQRRGGPTVGHRRADARRSPACGRGRAGAHRPRPAAPRSGHRARPGVRPAAPLHAGNDARRGLVQHAPTGGCAAGVGRGDAASCERRRCGRPHGQPSSVRRHPCGSCELTADGERLTAFAPVGSGIR